jgi:peptide/nickel transport system ATP-binding protein
VIGAEKQQALVPGANAAPVLAVEGLEITRVSQSHTATIVSSMSLTLAQGETVGIVGESGSGKSMTARAITGLLPKALRASGEVRYGGRNLLTLSEREWRAIRGREIGLILQDPFTMLNPVMTCGRILKESLISQTKRRRNGWHSEAVRRLAEVGIHDESVLGRYPFQLSGGMRQRVAIAAALARDPRVLVADEPSTALDVTTQREILGLMKRLQETRGMGLILITHDLRVAFAMCERIYVLYAGSLLEVGPSESLEEEPRHPYTQGLLLSEPPADRTVRQLVSIPGAVPAPDDVAGSCVFAPRCQWAIARCRGAAPPLVEVAPGRSSACIRATEIRTEMVAERKPAEATATASVPALARTSPSVVTVSDAGKVFQTGRGAVTALEGVSIEVRANESVGVVGESGSGKTTLARIIVGLEDASSGEVIIDGIDASNWSSLRGAERRRLRGAVQIVFQDPYSSLNPMRSVGSTLSEAITLHQPRARYVRSQVAELLMSVGLPEAYAIRRPAALSGGERQRVAIARTLAARPRLLICDEPVSALDVSVQAQVLTLFARLREERELSYLFITHDLSIVRQISEYLYVMHRGRVVEDGPTETVLDRPKAPYTAQLLSSIPKRGADWLGSSGGVESLLPAK